ncbi:MAG: cytochrome c peroxidase [Chitinophagaceae bacterium]
MKRYLKAIMVTALGCMGLFAACKKDAAIPDYPGNASWDISFSVPQGWPSPYYAFKDNQLTKAGFMLGRKLFYDTRLSKDSSTSCGSCHQSFAAFSQTGHNVSHGVNGLLGNRNSPALFNLNWNTSFMWDGGVNHIEVQPTAPITNPVEMDETLDNVMNKLKADAEYHKMFIAAFGTDEITSQRMLKALAQFMGSMVSDNAKYDKVQRGQAQFSDEEAAGLTVFESKCATCHPAPLFTDHSFRNVGIKPGINNDSGRAHITLSPDDLYKFRVPSLRNLSYTAPYLHDGRFETIDQVLDQMESGIYASPSLDPLVKDGLKLSSAERSNLKAFLKTLDDETFVSDKRFAEQ